MQSKMIKYILIYLISGENTAVANIRWRSSGDLKCLDFTADSHIYFMWHYMYQLLGPLQVAELLLNYCGSGWTT